MDKEKILFFLSENSQKLVSAAVFAAIVFIVIFKFFLNPEKDQLAYSKARSAYEKWQKGDDSAFKTLKGLIVKNSSLAAFYEGKMVGRLLSLAKEEEAKPIAQKVLKRTASLLPPYADFAETTLLITDKKYEDALKRALGLRAELSGQENELLYGFNLFRLAALYQKLCDKENERKIWGEIKIFLAKDTPRLKLLAFHFSSNAISVQDFISYRENLKF